MRRDYLKNFLKKQENKEVRISIKIGTKLIEAKATTDPLLEQMENFDLNPFDIIFEGLQEEMVVSELSEEERLKFHSIKNE